jgi:excinuclease ABC subunit A
VIDLGPDGGKDGGNLVFQGTPEELVKVKESWTGKFLKEKLS